MTKRKSHQELTQQETKLYDRQIRLWGLNGQQALRNAKIITIGNSGTSHEVLKNIVLAGVDTISICDDRQVTIKDLSTGFLLTKEHVGNNYAESLVPALLKLNPRVNVLAYKLNASSIDEEILGNHDVLLNFHSTPKEMVSNLIDNVGQNVQCFECQIFMFTIDWDGQFYVFKSSEI